MLKIFYKDSQWYGTEVNELDSNVKPLKVLNPEMIHTAPLPKLHVKFKEGIEYDWPGSYEVVHNEKSMVAWPTKLNTGIILSLPSKEEEKTQGELWDDLCDDVRENGL